MYRDIALVLSTNFVTGDNPDSYRDVAPIKLVPHDVRFVLTLVSLGQYFQLQSGLKARIAHKTCTCADSYRQAGSVQEAVKSSGSNSIKQELVNIAGCGQNVPDQKRA